MLWKLGIIFALLTSELHQSLDAFHLSNVNVNKEKFKNVIKQHLPNIRKFVRSYSRFSYKAQTAIANKYGDELITNINQFIQDTKMEPIPLPGFNKTFSLIILKGRIAFDNGWLRGLSTITRKGDIKVEYEYPNLEFYLDLGFKNLNFDYKYEASLLNIGPRGTAKGESRNSKFTVSLKINLINLRAKLNSFKLHNAGHLKLSFDGGILEVVLNVIMAVVVPLISGLIHGALQNFICDGLIKIITFYNQFIFTLLGGCSGFVNYGSCQLN